MNSLPIECILTRTYEGEHYSRPPLGIIPRDIWIEKHEVARIKDLARAINEYIQTDRFEPVKEWVIELNELLIKY